MQDFQKNNGQAYFDEGLSKNSLTLKEEGTDFSAEL
jgi:hypothetical protein